MKSNRRNGWVQLAVLAVLAALATPFALAAVREQAKPAVRAPSPELPREWRWHKKAVTFDDMFAGAR